MHARLGVTTALLPALAALFRTSAFNEGAQITKMSNIFRIYFELNPPRDEVIVIVPRRWGKTIGLPRIDKSKWLIVHPTANLQRERNTFRAAQLWKIIRVSDVLTLIGTFYSAGITVDRPVEE
jgi:hypothetical protein